MVSPTTSISDVNLELPVTRNLVINIWKRSRQNYLIIKKHCNSHNTFFFNYVIKCRTAKILEQYNKKVKKGDIPKSLEENREHKAELVILRR